MKYICLGYIEKGKFEGMTEGEQHAMLDRICSVLGSCGSPFISTR